MMEDKTNNKVQDVEFYKQAYEQEKLRAASSVSESQPTMMRLG